MKAILILIHLLFRFDKGTMRFGLILFIAAVWFVTESEVNFNQLN